MPRLMSFAKTVDQIRDRTKTVTRRDGWTDLEEGDVLQAVTKMPFADPDGWERICLIEVVDVRRERVDAVLGYDYRERVWGPDDDGWSETKNYEAEAEGFPEMSGREFVEFFEKELGAAPDDEITRIEFRYLEERTDG